VGKLLSLCVKSRNEQLHESKGNWINELRCLRVSIWFSEGRGQEFESLRVRHFLVSICFKVERRFSIIHFLWLKLLRTEFERIEVLTSRYLEKHGRRPFFRNFVMEIQFGKKHIHESWELPFFECLFCHNIQRGQLSLWKVQTVRSCLNFWISGYRSYFFNSQFVDAHARNW